MDWGEDEFGEIGKGRKEVNILRRRERWSRQRPKIRGGAELIIENSPRGVLR